MGKRKEGPQDLFESSCIVGSPTLAEMVAADGDNGVCVRQASKERFIKGPVWMWWLAAARDLPGQTLIVGLILWRHCGVAKGKPFKFSLADGAELSVNRKSTQRAIQRLEKAGLITVNRPTGCKMIVTIRKERIKQSEVAEP